MNEFAVGQKVKVVAIDPEFGDDKDPLFTQCLGEEHVIIDIRPDHMYPIEVAEGHIFRPNELEVLA